MLPSTSLYSFFFDSLVFYVVVLVAWFWWIKVFSERNDSNSLNDVCKMTAKIISDTTGSEGLLKVPLCFPPILLRQCTTKSSIWVCRRRCVRSLIQGATSPHFIASASKWSCTVTLVFVADREEVSPSGCYAVCRCSLWPWQTAARVNRSSRCLQSVRVCQLCHPMNARLLILLRCYDIRRYIIKDF